MARTTAVAFAVGAVVAIAVAALAGALGGDASDARGSREAADDGSATSAALDVNAIYERARAPVVFIQARVERPRRSPFGLPSPGRMATGSGFVYDERGHIVTNAHVVENAREVAIQLGDNKLLDARVVGSDLSTDLAVLRVDRSELDARPLPLADDGVEVGDPVVAVGNPLGLEDTITRGIVSALQRRITAPNGFAIEDAIQSDAAINPGNSGGPLLDAKGRVLGVNSQIATAGSRGFIGIGFAVPSKTVRRVVPTLIRDGEVERPYLGVSATDVTPSVARRLDLPVTQGALVTSIAPGSPAARAGLRAGAAPPSGAITAGGDVIVSLAGRDVGSGAELAEVAGRQEIGERVTVRFVRDGRRLERSLVIADRPG